MQIKIFVDDDKQVKSTPFYRKLSVEFLEKHEIITTNDISNSDVIVCVRPRSLHKYKDTVIPILVWTHEPRFLLSDKHIDITDNVEHYVMSVYTNNVFTNNFYGYQHVELKNVKKTNINKKIVILATYKSMYQKIDADVAHLRCDIAEYFFERNMIDIYGAKWPDGMSIENSRNKFHEVKGGILENYDISLCCENTNWPNYTTEKIWDAINAYTLPIYYANDTIYDIFPENSFIDLKKFESIADLYNFVQNLTDDEYNERLNKCINVAMKYKEWESYEKKYYDRDMNIVNKLREIVTTHKKPTE